MTNTTSRYEVRVAGHLDDHWSAWLGDLTLTRHDDGTTALTGAIADQAQLHGVLAAVRDLGATLLSLKTCDPAAGKAETGKAKASAPAARPSLERPLHLDRVTLRAATADDADATWKYRRLDSVGQWLTEVPTDLEAYRATFADPARLATTVVVERNGDLIGDFMLRVEDAWAQTEVADQARGRQAELGWVLDPAYTGHGYATEVVRGLLEYCFTGQGCAPRGRELLPGQRHLLAAHGTRRDATGGPRGPGVAAQVGAVARHRRLRPAHRGVAGLNPGLDRPSARATHAAPAPVQSTLRRGMSLPASPRRSFPGDISRPRSLLSRMLGR